MSEFINQRSIPSISTAVQKLYKLLRDTPRHRNPTSRIASDAKPLDGSQTWDETTMVFREDLYNTKKKRTNSNCQSGQFPAPAPAPVHLAGPPGDIRAPEDASQASRNGPKPIMVQSSCSGSCAKILLLWIPGYPWPFWKEVTTQVAHHPPFSHSIISLFISCVTPVLLTQDRNPPNSRTNN